MQPKGSPPNSSNENMANFPTGVGLQFAQEAQRNPSQITKKRGKNPPLPDGLSKPRNGLPPLDTTIHPAFLIGGTGSVRNAGEGLVENGLGRPSSDKEKWTGSRPRLGKARGEGSDHRAPSI